MAGNAGSDAWRFQREANVTKNLVITALLELAAGSGSARAEAGFVPAANATDMVYDVRRHQIDIVNGDEVVR